MLIRVLRRRERHSMRFLRQSPRDPAVGKCVKCLIEAGEKDWTLTMRRIAQLRFFCSQNSFLVFDASREPTNQSADFKKLSNPQSASKSAGWIRVGDAIAF